MDPKKFQTYTLLLLTITLLFSACKKETYPLVWSELTTPTTANLNDIQFTDENTGYVAGGIKWQHGELLTTADAGQTWTSDTLSNNLLNSFSILNNQYHHLTGFNGRFLSKDQTVSPYWVSKFLPSNTELHAITYYDQNNGIAVGGGSFQIGIIYRFSTIDGQVDVQKEDVNHEMRDVCFINANEAIAVGYGAVFKTYDAGRTWEPKPIVGEFFLTVHFPTPLIGYAAGLTGTIIKTTDGGETWEKLRNGNKVFTKRKTIRDLYFTDQDKGYLVGDGGLLWITENGGNDWKRVALPEIQLNSIHVVDGIGHIAGENGRIFKFID